MARALAGHAGPPVKDRVSERSDADRRGESARLDGQADDLLERQAEQLSACVRDGHDRLVLEVHEGGAKRTPDIADLLRAAAALLAAGLTPMSGPALGMA